MNKNKIKINSIISFIFILFIIPIVIPSVNYYLFYIRVLFGLIALPLYFINYKRVNNSLVLCCFLMCLGYYINALLSHDFTLNRFFIEMYPFGIYLLTILLLKRDYTDFIKQLRNVCEFVVILFIIGILYNIITNNPIMPVLQLNRNGVQFYLTFIIVGILSYIDYCNSHNKFDVFCLIIAFIGILISGSATGVISSLIGVVALLFYKRIKVRHIVIVYVFSLLFLLVIQNFNIPLISNLFLFFHKSSTFSSRLWRWNLCIKMLPSNLFFGVPNMLKYAISYAGFYMEQFNPHNGILNILIYGGLFSLIFELLIFVKSVKNLKKSCFKRSYIVLITMCLITSLMESNISHNSFSLFLFLIIIIVFPKKGKNYEKQDKL